MERRRNGQEEAPASYMALREQLIARLRPMAKGYWNPTPVRKKITEIVEQLEALAQRLQKGSSAHSAIEEVHRERYAVEGEAEWTAFNAAVGEIAALAESARAAADRLPEPRRRPHLPWAADCLLHLRYLHGFPLPMLSDKSDDVIELQDVLAEAGIVLSAVRVRNLLSVALKSFDPHLLPPGLDW